MKDLIARIDPLIATACLAVALAGAWLVGAWLAHRKPASPTEPRTKFGDATMALLGLLLAFTFGTSVAKNNQRRLLVVEEANAIGAFYTGASLLDEPVRNKLRQLIRRYTQLCVKLGEVTDPAPVDQVSLQLAGLQQEMVGLVGQAVHGGTPIGVALVNELNALIDNSRAQVAAIEDRLPVTVVGLLFASAIAATLLMGREHHRLAARDLTGTGFFILMVCLVVYVSADLNRPIIGLARVSQAPIVQLLSSMPP